MTDHRPLTVEACERRLAAQAERIKPAESAADVHLSAPRPPEFGRLVHPGEIGTEDEHHAEHRSD